MTVKYIRGQDGSIYSVSRLMPPCVGHPGGEPIWRLRLISADGYESVYAAYSAENSALLVYKTMKGFMASRSVMITFGLGINALPDEVGLMVEAVESVLAQLDEVIEGEDDHLGESPAPLDDTTAGGPLDVKQPTTDNAREETDDTTGNAG